MNKQKRQHNKGKICPRCKENKHIHEFGKHREYNKRRINSWCKECHREYSKLQKRAPGYKERNAAYMKEYRRRRGNRASVIK